MTQGVPGDAFKLRRHECGLLDPCIEVVMIGVRIGVLRGGNTGVLPAIRLCRIAMSSSVKWIDCIQPFLVVGRGTSQDPDQDRPTASQTAQMSACR